MVDPFHPRAVAHHDSIGWDIMLHARHAADHGVRTDSHKLMNSAQSA